MVLLWGIWVVNVLEFCFLWFCKGFDGFNVEMNVVCRVWMVIGCMNFEKIFLFIVLIDLLMGCVCLSKERIM